MAADRHDAFIPRLTELYDQLRAVAAQLLVAERSDHTLQATALVHEAWLRLHGVEAEPHWTGAGHFFATAARTMRRILIDHARAKATAKRGADGQRSRRLCLDALELAENAEFDLVLAVD